MGAESTLIDPVLPRVHFVFSGLCVFVADSWRTEQGKANVGVVEVLVIDPRNSALGSRLCKHYPALTFTEFDGSHSYVQAVRKNGRKGSALRSLTNHKLGGSKEIFGLLPLRGRRLQFSFLDSNGRRIQGLGTGVDASGSFKGVLDLDDLLGSKTSQGGLANRSLKDSDAAGGIVASRLTLSDGEIGGIDDFGEMVAFYPETGKKDESNARTFFQNVTWSLPVPPGARKFAIEVFKKGVLREVIEFDAGNPSQGIEPPTFSVSNLCGSEAPLPDIHVGVDFAAYYDVTELEVRPVDRFVIHPVDDSGLGIENTKSGSGYCAPAKVSWGG